MSATFLEFWRVGGLFRDLGKFWRYFSLPKTRDSILLRTVFLNFQLFFILAFRLMYERDQLLKKINVLLKNFDAELRLLRHDKFKMDIDLKNADLR